MSEVQCAVLIQQPDFHLLVMQDRFGILQFIYYCLLVKFNIFN
jgi:hypothetical protein